MEDAQVLRVLSRMNTWWNGDEIPDSLLKAEHRRRDFYHLKKRITSNQSVLTIRGPRQVGKTTIVGQLIYSLLNDAGHSAENILYINAENSQVISNSDNIISDSIDVYQSNVLRESIREIENTIYVFIDEVQKLPDWASKIKYYTDTYSGVKFVLTGSISTLIRQESSETLVGRLDEYLMMPMKFIEYVRYHEVLDKSTIYEKSNTVRKSLKTSVKTGDTDHVTPNLVDILGRYGEVVPKIRHLKDRYLLKGGYPGVIDENISQTFSILDSNITNTVTGDIPSVFPAQKPEQLLRLISLIAYSSGQKLSVNNLANSTKLDNSTVDKYLEYLEEFFLIDRISKHRVSEYDRGGQKMGYVSDVGHLNTLNANLAEETLENNQLLGPILETAIFDHSKRLQFYLSDHQSSELAYWDGRGEVDFVLSGQNYVLPIEVKNGDPENRDLRGIQNFISVSNADFGIVVNNSNVLKEDKDLIYIPSWLFMFLC